MKEEAMSKETLQVEMFLKSTFDPCDIYQVRDRLVCNDGFSVSVQGGTEFHYCLPRMHTNEYEYVELGFPSEPSDLILQFAEDSKHPERTVYGFVPIEIVEQLIQSHGGIDSKFLFGEEET
jgi:hypothetical protein